MDDGAPLAKSEARGELYNRDFYAWGLHQAELLRAGRFGEIDIENIAEEIESLSRSDKRELSRRLSVLMLHLLKWRYQPEFRSQSWKNINSRAAPGRETTYRGKPEFEVCFERTSLWRLTFTDGKTPPRRPVWRYPIFRRAVRGHSNT